ncbi:MAG: hypothetical protein ABIQ89_02520 [Candidatus Saccharimonadales bacterium]
MAESAQTPTNLQQTGAQAVSTGNPQEVVQGGLQPQAGSNLQPSSTQTINSVNALDQGTGSINLSAISNSSTTTVPVPIAPKKVNDQLFLYGGVAVICIGILGYMVYNLLKPHS